MARLRLPEGSAACGIPTQPPPRCRRPRACEPGGRPRRCSPVVTLRVGQCPASAQGASRALRASTADPRRRASLLRARPVVADLPRIFYDSASGAVRAPRALLNKATVKDHLRRQLHLVVAEEEEGEEETTRIDLRLVACTTIPVAVVVAVEETTGQ